ncbi:MAG: penicillin-binding transpeptidase domain-containing protein [Oscillospiraceae bacterium]|jgi:stage V sporulation protein D (sporulation-specific penicillin-binding protein)|nr:PASTA domain-containing protein [Bacillota bacterium]
MKSKSNAEQEKRKKQGRQERIRADRGMLSRTGVILILCGIVAFLPVVGMLTNLMVFRHDEYSEKALNNQTRTTTVTASRGNIYDRNMNVMAVSTSVENVFLDPKELHDNKVDLDLVANTLGEILSLDPTWIREQAADITMRYKMLATKQPDEVTSKIRDFIVENDIIGIHMEPDSKRTYPYSSLAAQVIGFTNSSNVGAEGIEAYYNNTLEGTAGKVITTKGNYETEMPYSFEKYYEASNGNSVVLTLDTTLQYYLEKNMQAAIEKYDVQNGAFGLIMNVKTGEVLAMATLGGYDPNNYLEIGDPAVQQELDRLKGAYSTLQQGSEAYDKAVNAYQEALVAARLAQWRNRVVSDGYEPGSTFKTITMAAAIEEGTTTVNDSFYCGGSEMFVERGNTPLHCWRHSGHGAETTFEALQNSCNLAFAHIGLRLGGEKFYEYVKAFGLLEPTGLGMSGESSGVFFPKSTITDPTANGYGAALIAGSFGQTFKVTPVQLVRAISAVVNGGYLMQPYVVSEILDDNGNVVEKTEPTVIRQVISESTSAIMRDMILSVVEQGTAGNAKIAGYSIGGKTGTSEKIDVYDEEGNGVDDKIVSFVGIAPMDDPQYIVLVALDTPSTETGYYISGGVMAAPTVRGVLEDILPYLNVARDYTGVDMSSVEVEMPALAGMTEQEAKEALQEESLTYELIGSGSAVTGQIPQAGAKLPGNSEVILYMGEEVPSDMVTVPDFTGMTIGQANQAAANAGLYILVKGATEDSGYVTATGQDVEAGTSVVRGSTIRVDFVDHTAQD